jgi:hypothetical protein
MKKVPQYFGTFTVNLQWPDKQNKPSAAGLQSQRQETNPF